MLFCDSLSRGFLDPVRIELFLACRPEEQRYIIDRQSQPREFVAVLLQLPLNENNVDKLSDQGSAEIDDSELEKSLFSFCCNFVSKRLRHLRFTHEGSGDSGAVKFLYGHPGRADEQSATLYGNILLQASRELD